MVHSIKQILRFLLVGMVNTVLLSLLALNAEAGPERGAGHKNFPKVHLQKITRGEEAIAALGNNLPAVAAAYGHSPERLLNMLRHDPTLTVDHRGRLLYTHEMELSPELAALPTGSSPTNADPLAVGDVFTLHSRPGAGRIVYLNFTGCTVSGTAWNDGYAGGADIVCAPFDTDGNPSVFSDDEKSAIQEIWQRVAEDYVSFDVDVTTAYPGADALNRSSADDTNYGMFVVISPSSGWFGGSGGGVSYVGCFDDIGDYYKPNFVFANNLLNMAKFIAEACSHEVGHTLGLSHMGITNGVAYYAGQGTGETGWAPIMGASYYRNLSQWSKGEYANANNFEDELAIITTGGLDYRADDHGDTDATATLLPAGAQFSATGVIERNTDVDVFAFNTSAAGVTLTVTPAALGPNLDLLVELYDSTGALLATNNPADSLSASISLNVAAGQYFLHVRGTGNGDPAGPGYSSYGCLGSYTVSGTLVDFASDLPPVAVATASPASGYAPLGVTLDGSSSYDPDGTVVAWQWAFGDGGTGSGATLQHTYTAAGNYTASLTVTDNLGKTNMTTVGIAVTVSNQPPVAIASASPASGYAPLGVTLIGASSYDPDGTIVSWQWAFGDGATGSGATVQHTYTAASNYTARLTVTDNLGKTNMTTVAITVTAPNQPPVAVASANPASGYAPLGVTLNGASSYDPDGTIVSWQWAFGDGATGSGATVQHTYTAVGTYTAVLTVTDNRGATATNRVTIQVQTAPPPTVRVSSISLVVATNGGWKTVQATVKVTDLNGASVSGVRVNGNWTGLVTGTGTATTDASGNAVLTSARTKSSGNVTFTVTSLSKTGYVYDPSKNVVSSATIAVR